MTPERLAKIRAFDVGDPATWVAQDEGDLVSELLAHIDTLTAERDALRAALIPQACFDHSTSEKIHIARAALAKERP